MERRRVLFCVTMGLDAGTWILIIIAVFILALALTTSDEYWHRGGPSSGDGDDTDSFLGGPP